MEVTVVTNVLEVVTVEVELEYTEILYDVAVPPLDVQVTAPVDNDSATLVGANGGCVYFTELDIAETGPLPPAFIPKTVTA